MRMMVGWLKIEGFGSWVGNWTISLSLSDPHLLHNPNPPSVSEARSLQRPGMRSRGTPVCGACIGRERVAHVAADGSTAAGARPLCDLKF